MSKVVTVIYYAEASLELHAISKKFDVSEHGRVIIPDDFKVGKSIIAVCEGNINILNKVGDRITAEPFISKADNLYTQ